MFSRLRMVITVECISIVVQDRNDSEWLHVQIFGGLVLAFCEIDLALFMLDAFFDEGKFNFLYCYYRFSLQKRTT